MGFTLESFAADVHRILKEDPNRAGREKVRALVQEALKDEEHTGLVAEGTRHLRRMWIAR